MSEKTPLILFVLIITLNVIVATENKQECSQKDFRSYAHCIRKRQASHWCSSDGCSRCLENNCIPTCKGFSCGLCPNGDCCDGKNCNVCWNNFCCLTSTCNYCIRACQHACSNDLNCQNLCIPQCQNTNHDIFITPSEVSKSGKPQVIVYIKGKPHKGNITKGHIPNTNKTATVSINGTDYPATVLIPFPAGPINLCQNPCNSSLCTDTANITLPLQNCNPHCPNQCPTANFKAQNQIQGYYNLPQGCCHVVHPHQCFSSPIYPYQHCSIRSHQECSDLCTSRFVHLTPQARQQNHCHFIQNYPYIYCGQNSIQNCDSCYECNGKFNPSSCVQAKTCSNICRQNFLAPNSARIQTRTAFAPQPRYNRIPYQTPPRTQQRIQLPLDQNLQFMGRPLQYG